MGYYPLSSISNGGWEYHQETSNSGHSNSWSYASEPQDEKENHMGYQPPPQNDSYHYPHGGWEYHQGMKENEHFPEPQSDSYCYGTYTNDGWEGKCNDSHSNYSRTLSLDCAARAYLEECSSLDYASTQSFLQDPYNSLYQLQNLFHNPQDSFHTTQNNFTTAPTYPEIHSQPSSLELAFEQYLQTSMDSWKEQEILLKKMDGHLEQIRRNLKPSNSEDEDQFVDEEVEKQEPKVPVSSEIVLKDEEHELRILHSQELIEVTIEHEDSLPKDLMESCEEGMEEDNQEKSHSIEAEKCIEEGLMEPLIQEALDEDKTPTIKQPPRLGFKKVKAINKSTEKRIMTKLQRTIFMKKRRSTTSNPPPDPASKLNQAINKRKLAEERPRQGAIAESSPPLRSFLLTN
ncbi:hypothetical protein AHAS_Ahas14G0155900 [Arachis hypogaea]